MSKISEKIEAVVYCSRQVLLNQLILLGYNSSAHTGASVREVASMIAHNQLDMLLTRGGGEPDDDHDDHSVSTSSTATTMKSTTSTTSTTTPTASDANKIYIRYALTRTVRPNVLNELVEELFYSEQTLTKQDTLIVVVKDPVNSTLTDAIVELWERDKIFVIVHHLARLQYNILDHEIVPPHIVMEATAAAEVYKKYNASSIDFPNISRFDPVAQAICLRPGQMCKILRPSKTAIKTEYYRVCV